MLNIEKTVNQPLASHSRDVCDLNKQCTQGVCTQHTYEYLYGKRHCIDGRFGLDSKAVECELSTSNEVIRLFVSPSTLRLRVNVGPLGRLVRNGLAVR